ncbi:MAG TPA: FtsX-like permease family protein, partial [Acidimicrobiia bacterium]|nr:FtsX-like permease family protein [Acidimicrobiia bacterium]
MLKVALRGLLARKFRLALTATAVLLGVMFVTTTYVLTDTLDASFDRVFTQSLSDVDMVVRAAPVRDDDRSRMPQSVVDQVRGIDGVATASGFVQGYAQLVGRDGEAVDKGGPAAGVTFVGGRARGPMLLVDDGGTRSRAPDGAGEVAVDVGTAREAGLHVGDTVDVLSAGPRRTFDLVGLFRLGDADTGPFAFAAFDLPTSQTITAATGRLDSVYVRGDPGVAPVQLRRALRTELGPAFDVDDPDQVVRSDNRDVGEFVDLLTGVLLGFAALGVVVGAFIIFNTFTILVTQRTHELALLRALGASRQQVITSVVVEAGVVGALASAAGVLLGVVVARLLMSLVDSLGFRIPTGEVVVVPRTVVLAVAVGFVVTVGAALWPAIRASRIPPVAAIGDLPEARVETFRRRAVVGLLLLCVGVPVLLLGVSRAQGAGDALDELPLVGLGALLVFFATVVLLATFARPLARGFGAPVRIAVGVPGAIARGNAMRNPRRTAATASALVIGLALVAMVAVLGQSAKAQIDASDSNLRAELVLDTTQFTGFSPEVIDRVERLPEVQSAVGFHFGRIPVEGQRERIVGMNGSGLADAFDLELEPGSTADIATDEILVAREEASQFDWSVGDSVSLSFPLGERAVRVVGVYGAEDVSFGSPIFVSRELFRASVPEADLDYRAYVSVAAGVPVRTAKAAIEREIGRDFPNLEVLTQDEARDAEAELVDQFLGVLVALLFLSEAIAVLGIVNTLALSVHERTHEIGMLRAVGMTRRQLRRSVRWESVIIAAIGGLVGL